jgi:hypothetical protein
MKKELDFVEILEKGGSEEWNTALSGHLEAVKGWLAQDAWKHVQTYLKAVAAAGIDKLLKEGGNLDYMRGFITALRLVLALPSSVKGQLDLQDEKQKRAGKIGPGGY